MDRQQDGVVLEPGGRFVQRIELPSESDGQRLLLSLGFTVLNDVSLL